MLQQITLYALVDTTVSRRIHAICGSAGRGREGSQRTPRHGWRRRRLPQRAPTNLEIHAMNAAFPGDRYRLVYGRPVSTPSHPLDVPGFQGSRIPNTDAQSDAYLYPDELFVYRKEALAAAARHNLRQLCQPGGPLDWAVVVEIGEPLWRRYRSECLVRKGLGWEETDLVRPVRVIHPTEAEVTNSRKSSRADVHGSTHD